MAAFVVSVTLANKHKNAIALDPIITEIFLSKNVGLQHVYSTILPRFSALKVIGASAFRKNFNSLSV